MCFSVCKASIRLVSRSTSGPNLAWSDRAAPLAKIALDEQEGGARRRGQQMQSKFHVVADLLDHPGAELLQYLRALAGEAGDLHRAADQNRLPFFFASL